MKRKFKCICLKVFLLLLVAAIFLLCWFVFGAPSTTEPSPVPISTATTTPKPTVSPVPTPESSGGSLTTEEDGLPHDKFFITVERQNYKDNDLTLIIPKLEKELVVLNGVTDKILSKGIGLYDYAQLPGDGDRNVSVAGHRNGRSQGKVTDDAPFYYIDSLNEGDYLYLRDSKNIYRYLWDSCEIVAEDDWGPIYSQGFSCLTITSCHPIGVSDQRIIVRGRLEKIIPIDKNFNYLTSTEEVSE